MQDLNPPSPLILLWHTGCMFLLSFDAFRSFLLPFGDAYFLKVDISTIVCAVRGSPVRTRGFH